MPAFRVSDRQDTMLIPQRDELVILIPVRDEQLRVPFRPRSLCVESRRAGMDVQGRVNSLRVLDRTVGMIVEAKWARLLIG